MSLKEKEIKIVPMNQKVVKRQVAAPAFSACVPLPLPRHDPAHTLAITLPLAGCLHTSIFPLLPRGAQADGLGDGILERAHEQQDPKEARDAKGCKPHHLVHEKLFAERRE